MYGTFDVLTSGLVAQRSRMDVISANLLNRNTLLNEAGEYAPYRRQFVELAAGEPVSGSSRGVHVANIATDMSPFEMKYEPGSPHANADGYVAYPNVNPVIEQMNAMEVARAYEANIAAIEATKSMVSVALELIA